MASSSSYVLAGLNCTLKSFENDSTYAAYTGTNENLFETFYTKTSYNIVARLGTVNRRKK